MRLCISKKESVNLSVCPTVHQSVHFSVTHAEESRRTCLKCFFPIFSSLVSFQSDNPLLSHYLWKNKSDTQHPADVDFLEIGKCFVFASTKQIKYHRLHAKCLLQLARNVCLIGISCPIRCQKHPIPALLLSRYQISSLRDSTGSSLSNHLFSCFIASKRAIYV